MSIPERLYHLAKGKIGEIREIFDNQNSDADLDPELLARIQRAQSRKSARQELQDTIDGEPSPDRQMSFSAPAPRSTSTLRSAEEIRGAGAGSTASASTGAPTTTADPLAAHFRMLGLEPGSDYAMVQAVYEKLSNRCKPDRFSPGSPEAVEAHDIQTRLDATYKVLREALDPTARRFDMLEL